MSNAVIGQFSDAEDGDDAIVNPLVNSVQVSFAQEGKFLNVITPDPLRTTRPSKFELSNTQYIHTPNLHRPLALELINLSFCNST